MSLRGERRSAEGIPYTETSPDVILSLPARPVREDSFGGGGSKDRRDRNDEMDLLYNPTR